MTEPRVFMLDDVRADGWFEQLGAEAPNFNELCRILGDRFVAFAVIVGVRITAITLDPNSPNESVVEFAMGERTESTLQLSLLEFRERLALTVGVEDPPPDELPEEPGPEQIQQFLGIHHVLLAPLYGVQLTELILPKFEPARVRFQKAGEAQEMSVSQLRSHLDELVQGEACDVQPGTPYSIDLAVLPEATEASEHEEWDRVIEILGGWPGPLSVLLRSEEGRTMDFDVRSTLANAMGLLGTAYAQTEREDWAEEVMRLGIQWGRESASAGDLFRRLGEIFAARESHGQAIGLLRRAITLGAASREVLPLLARCYAARERYVAASLCVDEALSVGVSPEDLADLENLKNELNEVFGSSWSDLRAIVPTSTSVDVTVRPPESVS